MIPRKVALGYSRVFRNLEFRQVNKGRILVIRHPCIGGMAY